MGGKQKDRILASASGVYVVVWCNVSFWFVVEICDIGRQTGEGRREWTKSSFLAVNIF